MEYKIDLGIWGSIFAVPTWVTDSEIKMCSETQLKVLLLILRDGGPVVDVSRIGTRLGILDETVADAIEYWKMRGLFGEKTLPQESVSALKEEKSATYSKTEEKPALSEKSEKTADGRKISVKTSRRNLTVGEVNELALKDNKIPGMLEELEFALKKPLSVIEKETFVYLYSAMELDPAYMVTAVEYCKTMGKTNIHYIEKTVTELVDRGVDTLEALEKFMVEEDKRHNDQQLVKEAFGIKDRELTKKEKEFIDIWLNQLHFPISVITVAYEKTVDATGKVAFPYMNKILLSWHEKDIKTPEKALNECGKTKPKSESASFDLSDIEEVLRKNVNKL